eukprot:7635318-Ditylum_brightwellii.AAC.1
MEVIHPTHMPMHNHALCICLQIVPFHLHIELDALLDLPHMESYDYKENLMEDSANLCIHSSNYFLIPIAIVVLVHSDWYYRPKSIIVHKMNQQTAPPHMQNIKCTTSRNIRGSSTSLVGVWSTDAQRALHCTYFNRNNNKFTNIYKVFAKEPKVVKSQKMQFGSEMQQA